MTPPDTLLPAVRDERFVAETNPAITAEHPVSSSILAVGAFGCKFADAQEELDPKMKIQYDGAIANLYVHCRDVVGWTAAKYANTLDRQPHVDAGDFVTAVTEKVADAAARPDGFIAAGDHDSGLGYIQTVAERVILDQIRRGKRRKQSSLQATENPAAEPMDQRSEDAFAPVDLAPLQQLLRDYSIVGAEDPKALIRGISEQEIDIGVPDIYLSALLLRGAGYQYDDIAELLGVSIGTVRSRIHRGREHLRAASHQKPIVKVTENPRINAAKPRVSAVTTLNKIRDDILSQFSRNLVAHETERSMISDHMQNEADLDDRVSAVTTLNKIRDDILSQFSRNLVAHETERSMISDHMQNEADLDDRVSAVTTLNKIRDDILSQFSRNLVAHETERSMISDHMQNEADLDDRVSAVTTLNKIRDDILSQFSRNLVAHETERSMISDHMQNEADLDRSVSIAQHMYLDASRAREYPLELTVSLLDLMHSRALLSDTEYERAVSLRLGGTVVGIAGEQSVSKSAVSQSSVSVRERHRVMLQDTERIGDIQEAVDIALHDPELLPIIMNLGVVRPLFFEVYRLQKAEVDADGISARTGVDVANIHSVLARGRAQVREYLSGDEGLSLKQKVQLMLQDRERADRVIDILQLDSTYASIVHMHFVQGMSTADIGAASGKSIESIQMRLKFIRDEIMRNGTRDTLDELSVKDQVSMLLHASKLEGVQKHVSFTERERQISSLKAKGHTNAECAELLERSVPLIQKNTASIRAKIRAELDSNQELKEMCARCLCESCINGDDPTSAWTCMEAIGFQMKTGLIKSRSLRARRLLHTFLGSRRRAAMWHSLAIIVVHQAQYAV